MLSHSPLLSDAIARVCREPATKILTIYPYLDHGRIVNLIDLITKFIQVNLANIGDKDFVFKFLADNESVKSEPLNISLLIDLFNSGANLVSIDDELGVLSTEKIDLSLSGLSSYSQNNKCCLFYFHDCTDMVIYANGLTLSEVNLFSLAKAPLTRKKFSKHAMAYQSAIIDHYKKRIRYGGQYSYHWKERSTRTLENYPRKTERIFHDNLQNWLDENLEGAMVLGGVNKVSDDETDIEIRVYGESNLYYILEVKWLGSNGATTYSEARLRDAIVQVKEYIQRDPGVSEVCLVAYDGRRFEEFDKLDALNGETDQWKQISYCQTEELPPKGKGLVFFLESKSASDKK